MAEPTRRINDFPESSPDRPDDPAGYKPLSPWAVAGLVLAGSYALFLLVCFVFSLVSRTPMLMTSLTLLWPLAAVLASLFGLLQVRRSEGTQAGAGAAWWGAVLGGLSGLVYAAYLVATSFGIGQQAGPVAQNWFDAMKEDKPEEAFLLTLGPNVRPSRDGKSSAVLRDEVENRFGPDKDSARGPFVDFGRGELFRRLSQAGAEAKVTSEGVQEWKFENNGYLVRHLYRVETPQGEFEVIVNAFGADTKGPQGRVWMIKADESGIQQGSVRTTALGSQMAGLESSAWSFANLWIGALTTGRVADAFLATRPPAERAGLDKDKLDMAAGFSDFAKGTIVTADPAHLWAPPPIKAELPGLLRKLFEQPGLFAGATDAGPGSGSAGLKMGRPPFRWTRDGDMIRVECDVEGVYGAVEPGSPAAKPKYIFDAVVTVETPASQLETPPPKLNLWRVVALDLRRAQIASANLPPGLSLPTR